jgi:ribosomal protein L24
MKKFLMIFLVALIGVGSVDAQENTKEELKAAREQLKSELKSKDVLKRQEKLAKLKAPDRTDVASVDELAVSSTTLLTSTKGFNGKVPELYKRTIGETVDGVTDVTVEKPTLEELTGVATDIATQIASVETAKDAVSKAADDAKALPPLKAPKALKSLNFSKDVLSLTLPELQLSAKVN